MKKYILILFVFAFVFGLVNVSSVSASGVGSLSAATNPNVGNLTIPRNATNVKIGSYTITASNAEDIKVSSIKIGLGSNAKLSYTNLMVAVNAVKFNYYNAIIPTFEANTFNFTGDPFIIKAGQAVVVDVYADTLRYAYAFPQANLVTTLATCAGYGVTSNILVNCNYAYGQSVVMQDSNDNIGFKNPGAKTVTVIAGQCITAFVLNSDTAGSFTFLGYAFGTGTGIGLTISSGGILPGKKMQVPLCVNNNVPSGVYIGTVQLISDNGETGEISFPITVNVVQG